ncbi:MAG: extracellular solute-binding protein [Clostridiales bacterium]
MKLKKFFILILAVIMSGSVFFTSCSNKDDDSDNSGSKDSKKSLRILWWGSQTRADATQEVLDNYAKENNVKFETEFADFKGYWDKIATFASTNSLPDIIQQDNSYIVEYATKNTLEDLQPYIDDGTFEKDNIPEDILELGVVNGKNYGISLGVNTQSIIYNPELYKKADIPEPTGDMTWEEYFKDAEEIYKKTKIQVGLPFSKDPKLLIEYWVRSAGKTLYSEDGTSLGFDDEELLVDLFKEEQRLIKTGAIYDPAKAALEIATEESSLVKEKSTGGFAWSNFLVQYNIAMNKKLGIVTLPKAPTGDEPGMYIKASMFFSVAASSENKEEAVKVINYFTNDIEANKILKADRGVPISDLVRENLKDVVDEGTKQTFDYIDVASEKANSAPPEPSGAQEIFTLAQDINDEVINNKKTPEEAAKDFIKKANDVLAKNK